MHVIATAGHVDHGKSTLVRVLTGMEPDRWAEERRRGMTIDLGYAWLTLPAGDGGPPRDGESASGKPAGEKLAFVDVPGHERFVPNMLAGLGPVPAVMFVVAADGGWMPQSAEHLAAIDALGVRHAILVVTRADLADPGPATRQALTEMASTSLGPVEAVAVSAVTGAGLDDLRGALGRLVARLDGPGPAAPVRLWIDRSFTIRGSGTVVTGTLPAGTVRNGQELLLTPSAQPVRVRALQALGEPVDAVTGVARVALNLRGVPADGPERGMALIEPDRWTLTAELDVRISPRAAAQPPKFPPELLLHIGSARVLARVRILGTHNASPGADGSQAAGSPGADGSLPGERPAVYARLRLRDPLPLHAGDRVLLRDPGAAGLAIYRATVLDPAPPPLARRGAGAAAVRDLATWSATPTAADLLGRHKLLRTAQLRAAGVLGAPAPGGSRPASEPRPVAGDWLADPAHWASLRAMLPEVVAEFCARDRLAPGMPPEAARAALKLPSRDLVAALVRPPVVLDGGYLRIAAESVPEPAGAPAGETPARTAPARAVTVKAVTVKAVTVKAVPARAVPATRTAAAQAPAATPPAATSPAATSPAATPPAATSPAATPPAATPPAATPPAATPPAEIPAASPASPSPASAPERVRPAGVLPPAIATAVDTVLDGLARDPFAAPDAERLRQLGLDNKAVATAARVGLLLRVADMIVLAPGADEEAARLLAQLEQPFTTSSARQALRTSRRVAIPLLEYLDRHRVTERLPGDLRRLRG